MCWRQKHSWTIRSMAAEVGGSRVTVRSNRMMRLANDLSSFSIARLNSTDCDP